MANAKSLVLSSDNSLATLLKQRDAVLVKVREIEESCEGIENENNARRVNDLNMEHAKFLAQKQELSGKVAALDARLRSISEEIATLSGKGIDRILDAIKQQRWYFFKNKVEFLMDKNTGLLWANLDRFPYEQEDREAYNSESVVKKIVSDYKFGIGGFRVPLYYEMVAMIEDRTFPFCGDSDCLIKSYRYWFTAGSNNIIDLNNLNSCTNWSYHILPCSDILVKDITYAKDVAEDNKNYTDDERAKFTLDLFVNNDLQPIFKNYDEDGYEVGDNVEITELFKKIYVEKPQLLARLQELQGKIESLQQVTLLSSEFDYTVLLTRYDVAAIDASVIKYYRAVQQWCDELLDKVEYYEKIKRKVIDDFSIIGIRLAKKYENSPDLTDEENKLFADRQRDLKCKFALGMSSIYTKILAVKKQADVLEDRIETIDEGEYAIRDLAILEQEPRASFVFIAENTAKIVTESLKKVEFFEAHQNFVKKAVEMWDAWTENYRVFKTAYRKDLQNKCESDDVEADVWEQWYEEWHKLRFDIECKLQPIIERGIYHEMVGIGEMKISIPEQIIQALEEYRNAVDTFYRDERKGIYLNFEYVPGGDLQEKFETESRIYGLTVKFQENLEKIIFSCLNAEDRQFILRWAENLLNIQIDELLYFAADKKLDDIFASILEDFAALKQKNYELFLNDAKAYGAEKKRQTEEFNALVRKMRNGLKKGKKTNEVSK